MSKKQKGVIPPGSVVRPVRGDHKTPAWKDQIGRRFRIGYYRPSDGLDCVWLVNERGEYEQTTDHRTLRKCFEVETLSNERDYFGAARKPLRPLRRRSPRAKAGASGGRE